MKDELQLRQHVQREEDEREAGSVIPLRDDGTGDDNTLPDEGHSQDRSQGRSQGQADEKALDLTHKGLVDVRRQQALRTLSRRLADLQTRLVSVREATRALSALELERRLTPDEKRQARSLRWESERLGHELKLLRQSFADLAS